MNKLLKNISFVLLFLFFLGLSVCEKEEYNNDYPFDIDLVPGKYHAVKYFIDDNELDFENDLNLEEYIVYYSENNFGYKKEVFTSHTRKDSLEWRMNNTREYIEKRFLIGDNQWSDWVKNQRIIKLTNSSLHVVFESNLEQRKIYFDKK